MSAAIEIHSNMPFAVVVELGINGLGIIRSLGKQGIPVIGIDSKVSNYGALSKYCKVLYCRDVNDVPLVDTLLNLGKKLDSKGVLFCSSDLSLLVISKYRQELKAYYNFSLPSDNVIQTMMNKKLFYDFASQHEFSLPLTLHTNNKNDVEKTTHSVKYPCVIKPEIRDSYWCQHVPNDKILFARSSDEFYRLFKKYPISNRPLIVQEWIHGNDNDVYFCLTYIDKNSRPLAIFTGRKIRQYPLLTGLTSAAESIWEPSIAKQSLRLLRTAGVIGLAGVEFKFCHKDMIFKITEPTVGRTDLQEAISTKSGLDIPYIAYLDAIGETTIPNQSFRQGIKWINEPLDIYSVSQYLRKDVHNLTRLFSSYKGKRYYALMDIVDPLPFLFFSYETFKKKIKRILQAKHH